MAKRCRSCCGPPPSCGTICPTVTGCNGTQLVGATVTITYKEITAIGVGAGGSGYTSPPTVLISTTNGGGGTATATITGGAVTGITVVTPGRYTAAPAVTLSGGGGSGATATATLSATQTLGTCTTTGQVASVATTANGTNYTGAPSVVFSGGGSPTTVATATANLGLGFVISPLSLDNGGSGYTSPPAMAFSPAGATGTTRLTATSLDTITLTSSGTGYTSAPTVSITGGNGSGATATASIGPLSSVSAATVGSGYTTATVGFSGGGGSGAAATATISGGQIVGYTLTARGSGYTSNPTVTITGDGTGATATATAQPGQVAFVTVTAGGSGYTQLPTVGFSGGGGGGASATAILTATSVGSLVLFNAGNAYPFPTTVTVSFSGGGGSGAAASCTVKYKVQSVTMTEKGAGYTSTPTVTFSGGSGSGAAANATFRVQCCVAIASAGTYTIAASGPTGYHFATATQNIAATCTTNSPTVALSPLASYTCTVCSPDPWPNTLNASSSLGGFTLTYTPGDIASAGWYGCISATGLGTVVKNDPTCPPASGDSAFRVLIRSQQCNWGAGFGATCCANGGSVTWAVTSCPDIVGFFTYLTNSLTSIVPLVIVLAPAQTTAGNSANPSWVCGPVTLPLGQVTVTP